jgi:hypothetical protein
MLIVSLKSYANILEENFSLLKLLKCDLIEDIKHIKVYSVPLLYSKILWTKCIEKIRELSINKAKNWECLAFTAGLFAVMILGQETPDEIYAKYGLNNFEREWKELFTQMIKIVNSEEKLSVQYVRTRYKVLNVCVEVQNFTLRMHLFERKKKNVKNYSLTTVPCSNLEVIS